MALVPVMKSSMMILGLLIEVTNIGSLSLWLQCNDYCSLILGMLFANALM